MTSVTLPPFVERLMRRFGVTHAARLQMIRYGATGLAAVVTDYGSFTLLLGVVRVPLFIATASSLLAGFVVSFVLNRMWVFGARGGKAHKRALAQLALYTVLFCFNTAFTYIFIAAAHNRFGLSEYVGKLCCIALVMSWNFVAYKRIIFRLSRDPAI